MNIKKSLLVLSAAAALAAALQSSVVSAKNCGFALPLPSPNSGECLSSNSHSFTQATDSQGTTSATWTYKLNLVQGPTDPAATAKLVNADGSTLTKDIIRKAACFPAKDPTTTGGFGPTQVCVTPPRANALSPRGMLVFLPGA